MLTARRSVVITTLIVAGATVAACGEINPFESTPTTTQPRQRPADANTADVEFLTNMTAHLQAGRALTAAALDPLNDATAETAAFARHIQNEDDGRIKKMTELLDSWGEPTEPAIRPEPPDALQGLDGVAFDDVWTELMLEHHAQAETIAEQVKRDGSSREVNNIAAGVLVDLGFETTRLHAR